MVRMARLIAALLAFALAPFGAAAQTAWPPEVGLELVLDPMPERPFVGEMMLATLRGRYIGNVALEHLEVPGFEDFSWMQLGAPVWSEQRIDNRATKVFEQRLAFFPQRESALTIGPITHQLTFAGQGQRVEMVATSASVAVEALAPPLVTGKVWWLPARAVTVRDEWEPEPDALAPEAWTHRTVTIEVAGLPPQALPPAPAMAAGGLFSFIDPEERSVRLTTDGPVSTVIWHYRMQPQSDAPADLDDIPVAWFDTGARVNREIVLRGREIAFAGTALPSEPGPIARNAVRVGVLGGAALGLALLLPGLGARRGPVFARAPALFAIARQVTRLRLAEFRRDGALARDALCRMQRARGVDPATSPALKRLDRHLFGPDPGDAPISGLTRAALAEIGNRFRRARRRATVGADCDAEPPGVVHPGG